MKQDSFEILQRQLLLIGYRPDNTLSENIEQVKNKSFITEQGAADRYSDYLNSEEGIRQHDIEMENKIANTYPNYCWNNGQGTILPGENKYGLSGIEAIPKSKTGVRFCAYRGTNNTLLFLPEPPPNGTTTEIKFRKGSIEFYNQLVQKRKDNKTLNPQDEDLYITFLQRLYPMDMDVVASFVVSDTKYTPWVRDSRKADDPIFGDYDNSGVKGDSWEDYTRYFDFVGYMTKDEIPYKNPDWADPRNEYDKFIDEWGVWIQVIAGILVGAATGGMGFAGIMIELGIELGLGAIVAQREFEKGDNISGTMSLIFAALPALKMNKYFRGVSTETFNSLSKKLAGANLKASSDIKDYVKFYNKLTLEEQQLMSQAIRTDKTTYDEIIKEITTKFKKPQKASFLYDNLADMLKSDKNLLKSKSWWKTNIGRDMKRMGITGVAAALAQIGLGEDFNDNDKIFLDSLHSVIPEELESEIAFNIFANDLTESQKSELVDNLKQNCQKEIDDFVNNFSKVNQKILEIKTQESVRDTLLNMGKPYVEFEEDDTNHKIYGAESEKELLDKGYVPFSQKLDSDSIDVSATKIINYVPYVKIIKK